MNLLTPSLRARLLANGRMTEVDHAPVVKLFNPLGAGVWLATELEDGGDILGEAPSGERDADRRVRLVRVGVGGEPRVALGRPAEVTEVGGAVVAGPGVDAREVDHDGIVARASEPASAGNRRSPVEEGHPRCSMGDDTSLEYSAAGGRTGQPRGGPHGQSAHASFGDDVLESLDA